MRQRLPAAGALAIALVSSVGALAYFTGIGSGTASAQVATLEPPTDASASATAPSSDVDVQWTASATGPNAVAPEGYLVRRFDHLENAFQPACGTTAGSLETDTSCTDLGVADGTYDYVVTAVYRSWTSTGDPSNDVTLANDLTPPSAISIVRTGASATNAASAEWLVTFSTRVTGVDASDFTLAAAGVSDASVTGVTRVTGSTYAVVASTGSGDGTLGLNLADDDSIENLAGVALGPGDGSLAGELYTVDRTAPTLGSIDRAGPQASVSSGPLSWTVTFSEPLDGVSADDFALATSHLGGAAPTISAVTAVGGAPSTTWTVTATTSGTTGANDGSIRLDLSGSATIADAATNPLATTLFTGQAYVYDTTAPVVTSIGRDTWAANPTNAGALVFSVTFSEPVSDVTTARFGVATTGVTGTAPTVLLATPSILEPSDTWTVTVSTAGAVGANGGSVRLDLTSTGAIHDLVGLGLAGTHAGDQAYGFDTTAPAVSSIDRAGSSTIVNTGPSWTVTFDEPVANLTAGNFGFVTSGLSGTAPTVSSVTASGGTPSATWTVTASTSGATASAGSIRLDLTDPTGVSDLATNALATTSFTGQSFGYDTVSPQVTAVSRANVTPTNAATVHWTVTFSEHVTGVDATDFSLAPTGLTGTPTITAVAQVDAATYTVTATTGGGTTGASGTLGLDLVDDDSIRDAATNVHGGPGPGGFTGEAYAIDKIAPLNALSLTAKSPAGSSFLAGTTVYYRGTGGGSGGSFTIRNAVSDGGSGAVSSATAALGGAATGWSHAPGTVSTPAGGPFYSSAFVWVEGAGSSPSEVVTAADAAGNTAATTLTFSDDSTAPTGGAVTVNGIAATGSGASAFNGTGAFSISVLTDFADSGAGLASSTLVREQASLVSGDGLATGACGSTWSGATTITSRSLPIAQSLTGPACYRYTLTGADNVGNTASVSATAMVDTTAPSVPGLALSAASGNTFINGSTVYTNPQAGRSGGFTAGATATDADSGIARISFPTLDGFTSGGGDDTSSPYSATYAWSGAGATAAGSKSVTAFDGAELSASSTFTVTPDTTAPTVAAPTVAAGYFTTTSVPVSLATASDSGSGIATTIVQRDEAALSGNVCGAFPGTFAATVVLAGGSDTTVSTGKCYRWREIVTDNVGNQYASAPSNVAKVDTSGPTVSVGTITGAVNPTGQVGCEYIDNAAHAAFYSTADNVNQCTKVDGSGATPKNGTFTVPVTASDPESAMLKVSYPALAGITGGGDVIGAGPSYTTTYTWNVASTGSGSGVTAYDTAGLTTATGFTITLDNTAPTLPTPTVAAGFFSSTSIPVALGTATDSGSGVNAGPVTVLRAVANLTSGDGNCGAFGGLSAMTLVGGNDTTVTTAHCYQYQLQVTDNVGNQGTSGISGIVKVDTTAPTVTVGTLTASANPCQWIAATAVYYTTTGSNGNSCGSASGSFTVPTTPADGQSGVVKVNFPALAGLTGGGDVSSPGPYQATYGWTASTSTSGAQTVTATNNSLLTGTATFTLTRDNTAPTGGAITATGSASTSYSSDGGVNLVKTDFTDAAAGIATNVITRAAGTLSGDACGTLSGATVTTITSGRDTSTLTNGCYQYTFTGTDNVGNKSTVQSAVVKVDTTGPSQSFVLSAGATGPSAGQYIDNAPSFAATSYIFVDAAGANTNSFTVTDTTSDADTGVGQVSFPVNPATPKLTGGGVDTTAPFTAGYSWSSTGTTGTVIVTASNLATATSTASFNVVKDIAAPTGGALTVNAVAASGAGTSSYSNTGSFAIGARTDYTEAESTTASGVNSSTLTMQQGTLSNGVCSSYGGAVTISGTTGQGPLVNGCYLYTLTGTDNVGNAASVFTTVQVDTTAPVQSLAFSGTQTGGQFLTGSGDAWTAYYSNSTSGTFNVTSTTTEAHAGMSTITFPAFTSTGWTSRALKTCSLASTCASNAYTWSLGAAAPASQTITAIDKAGNTDSLVLAFANDTTVPTGGAFSVNGTAATGGGSTGATTSTSFAIDSRTDYAEAQSASQSGLASSTLKIQSATLTSNTCGAAGSGGPYTAATTVSGTTNPALTAGYCYVYTLTGTDNVGGAASVKSTVKVNSAPTVTSTTPSARGQGGASQSITVTGTGFVSGAAVTFSGTGITVNSTTFVSATQLTASVTLAAGAATGARDVTVTNPDGGSGTCSGCFTVSVAPGVVSVSPVSVARAGGGTRTLTVTGTDFVATPTAAISGSGISGIGVVWNSSTSLTVTFTIATNATTGSRNLTITNPDGGTMTLTAAFSVT